MAKKFLQYRNHSFEIAYDVISQGSEKYILFLHGWGSCKELMRGAFGNAFGQYNHLYIDLPGFGKSHNEIALHTADYAKLVELFIQEIGCEVEVIVGHSFGGKVATLMSPPKLILLSSAGVVWSKTLKVRAKITLAKCMKKLGLNIGKWLRTQDANQLNEGMYQTLKNVVDEDFCEIFRQCPSQTWIFWGRSDEATPLKSGEKISKLIKQNQFFVLEGDHFFFLSQGERIAQMYAQGRNE
ncbi:2-hydroxy-6-oxohepta-2,4-dienoate hydrolase [Helicobacter enhydrae]|uniref:2-hydroxy-6-oxohepta-2,4-dienoate hydrolase n=1 Tax=Helicobacter enhydrae TaxID=222136 RepID=A0A1B1U759_9HELI|nr:alpha/beta hydrolase [Helicobacter enhydrae]ANV98599.1 2-hydroxy-6-oxohepta-2,4-dienoate hydrolase [Helicobacter enhydrae]